MAASNKEAGTMIGLSGLHHSDFRYEGVYYSLYYEVTDELDFFDCCICGYLASAWRVERVVEVNRSDSMVPVESSSQLFDLIAGKFQAAMTELVENDCDLCPSCAGEQLVA